MFLFNFLQQFIWRPYERAMEVLPESCTDGRASWCSDCYILWFQVVEYHQASRVVRQFGFRQWIPQGPPFTPEVHLELHQRTRAGRPYENWFTTYHSTYVQSWDERENHVVVGERTSEPSVYADYMEWFLERTVGYTRNPMAIPVAQPGFRDDAGIAQVLVYI